MKRRFNFIVVLAVVLTLSTGLFAAYAAHDDVDLTGEWYLWFTNVDNDFLMEFGTNVDGYPVFVLKQDGNKLNGIMAGPFGEILIAKGNIKGRELEMSGTLPQGVVTFKGRFEEGKINGMCDTGIHGSSGFMMAKK